MQPSTSKEPAIIHFRVGIGDQKVHYSCEEADILKHPNSTLAKCISCCKQDDGRSEENPIDIEHKGQFFGAIINYMKHEDYFKQLKMYSERDYKLLQQEAIFFGLDCLAEKCNNPPKPQTLLAAKAQDWSLEVFYNRDDLIETINAIDETKQPVVLVLLLPKREQNSKSQVYSEMGLKYMEEFSKCIQYGGRCFMLEEYDKMGADKPSVRIFVSKTKSLYVEKLQIYNRNKSFQTPPWFGRLTNWALVSEHLRVEVADIPEMVEFIKQKCRIEVEERTQVPRSEPRLRGPVWFDYPHVPEGWLADFWNSGAWRETEMGRLLLRQGRLK